MKMITPQSEMRKRSKDVPALYDYFFQEYDYKKQAK
jgi:uncharacterized protein YeaO (DUF488 family)